MGGTLTVAATGGMATFSGLTINKLGSGYTLSTENASLPSATSAPFNVTTDELVVTTQPPAMHSPAVDSA